MILRPMWIITDLSDDAAQYWLYLAHAMADHVKVSPTPEIAVCCPYDHTGRPRNLHKIGAFLNYQVRRLFGVLLMHLLIVKGRRVSAHANWQYSSPIQKNYFVSEASVYRLLKSLDLITSPAFVVIKAADEFRDKTPAINQMWQTDFTYLKVIGWDWMYLSTILDDYSRYVITWKLCTTMKTHDVTDTLELALQASGCDQVNVRHRPRLLSDNGASYISSDLANWLDDNGMDHVRGAPYHPQTQGKIERWHQTLKNRILLENHFLPGDLKAKIGAFVTYYNHHSYHESLGNVTPADAYFGRQKTILLQRERIKRQTLETRRLQHRKAAA